MMLHQVALQKAPSIDKTIFMRVFSATKVSCAPYKVPKMLANIPRGLFLISEGLECDPDMSGWPLEARL